MAGRACSEKDLCPNCCVAIGWSGPSRFLLNHYYCQPYAPSALLSLMRLNAVTPFSGSLLVELLNSRCRTELGSWLGSWSGSLG